MKKEEFKEFIKLHPELAKGVNSGKTSWQHLYELFDLYGSDSNVFDEFINSKSINQNNNINNNFNNAIETLKNIDMNSVKSNLSSIQKALSFLEDFTKPEDVKSITNVVNPKPFENFFND